MRTPIRTPTQTAGAVPALNVQNIAGPAVAGAVGAVGQSLMNVGQAADNLADKQANVYAAKAIADAKAKWTKASIERQNAAEGEAAGFAQSMGADFSQYAAEAMEMAPARARDRLSVAFTEYGGRLQADAFAFEATRRVAHRSDLLLSAVDQNRNTLLDDPSQFDDLLSDSLTAIDGADLPADVAEKLRREARGGLAVSATQGLISRNPGAALQRLRGGALDEHLDPDRKAALIRSAESEQRSRAAEARSIRAANQREYLTGFEDELAFVRSGNAPPADTRYTRDQLVSQLGREKGQEAWRQYQLALEDSDNVFTLMNGSPEDIAKKRASLVEAAQDPDNFRETQARLERFNRMAAESFTGFEDELAFIMSGNAPSESIRDTKEKLVAHLGKERGDEAWSLYEAAIIERDNLFVLMNGSPEDIEKQRALLEKSTQSVDDFRKAQARLERFDQMAVNVARSLADDPVNAVLSQSGLARGAGELLDGSPEGADRYAGLVLSEQEQRGIPEYARGVLTNGQASSVVAEVQRLPAAERGVRMAELSSMWGDNWPTVLRQMREADLDPATYHAALVADDPMLAERVAALADNPVSVLREGIATADANDIELSVFEEMQDFRMAFEAGDATGQAPAEFNRLYNVAVGVAMQEFRAGNTNAAQDAVDRLVNRRYTVVDSGSVLSYIPKRFDADAVVANAQAMQSTENLEAFDIMPLGMEDGVDPAIEKARMMQAAQNGVWVTNESATGLVLMMEVDGRMLPLISRDGRRYEVGFGEASLQGGSVRRENAVNRRSREAAQ